MSDPLLPLPRLRPLLRVVALRRGLARGLLWVTAGAALSSVSALALARWAPHTPRALALIPLSLSLAVLALARRELRRPLALAVELDRRLSADAAVLTAAEIHLSPAPRDPDLAARVTDDARRALSTARARAVFAPLPRRRWVPALAALALVPVAQLVPIRAAVSARRRPSQPRTPRPQAAEAARAVAEALREAALHDVDHADALRAAADRADVLSRELTVGVTQDQALAGADEVERAANESLDWARDPRNQRAVDAALAALDDPAARDLRDALARGDLSRVDEAARRLADQREARDRRAAEASLRQAAEEARRNGSNALARALDDEADLLHRRGQASALAREIAEALRGTQGGQRAAEHLQRNGDRDLSRALDEILRELDRELTADERRRLAQALARMSEGASGESRADLDRAARAPTPEELRRAMRDLVERLRRGGLDDTRAGRGRRAGAGVGAGMTRLRLQLQPGMGNGNGAGDGNGTGTGGPGPGGGHVDDRSRTRDLRGDGMVAPVSGTPDPAHPGVPLAVEHVDTTGARALTPSEVRLREAAPAALGGVEETSVPDGYREQLRVYFGQ